MQERRYQETNYEGSTDGEKPKEEVIEELRQEYREKDYTLDEKKDQIWKLDSNPDHRIKILEYCDWSKETVKIEELGTTLPNAIGLPPEVISGKLPEVVEFVKKADTEKYRSIKYIRRLKEFPEVLDKFLPTVITPGSILRRQDRMNRTHGENDWNIENTWGAIHDANHRIIAKILANDLEEIECYMGRPSNDKIYSHVELEEIE